MMWVDKNERLPELSEGRRNSSRSRRVLVWVPERNDWAVDRFMAFSDLHGGDVCLEKLAWHQVSHWMDVPTLS